VTVQSDLKKAIASAQSAAIFKQQLWGILRVKDISCITSAIKTKTVPEGTVLFYSLIYGFRGF
jgi:hypothetical protein